MRTDTRDYDAEVAEMAARLRARASDPAYASAPRFASYARISKLYKVSDDEKTIRQTWRNLREIERRGGVLVEILTDDNRSAWKKGGPRPDWDRLCHLVRTRAVDAVIARFLDRLMRQSRDLEAFLDLVEDHAPGGLSIVGDKREYRTGNAGDNRDLRTAINSAQYESHLKSEKLRDLNEDRLAEGDDRNGPSGFGHRWDSERLLISDAQLETERAAVRDGFAMVVDQGKSWGDVARLWTSRGLTTRNGMRWSGQAVRDCLQRPRHGGYTRKGEQIHGRQADAETSAIVDAAMYDRLLVKLDGRKNGRQPAESLVIEGERVESPHFVSCILRCDRCGYAMSGTIIAGRYKEDGARKRAYRCPVKGCRSCSVDARAAENWAGARVVEALSAPEHASMLARHDSQLAQLAQRISEYEAAIRETGETLEVAHESRKAKHRAEIKRYEAELSPLLNERDRLRARVASEPVAADVAAVVAKWKTAGPGERRRMVALALPDGFYCVPVGRKGPMLFAEDIMSRFSVQRGAATPTRTRTRVP